jgi:DNA-binding response OmpR family regulator
LPVAYRIGAEARYLKSDVKKVLKRVLSKLVDVEDRVIAPDRVRLGGKVYSDLSSREWRLLQYLLRARGHASEFTEVVDYVYGNDADDKDEALRQLTKNLNKKLTDQGCPLCVRFRQPHVYLR